MSTEIIALPRIKTLLSKVDPAKLIEAIEDSFVIYSNGQATVPPVGHLSFKEPPADVHIKYGFIEGDEYYVVKLASGFYDNPKRGLPSSNGMMLLFSRQTGEPLAVLLDEGYLTDIRTAIAGTIAAKYLAPSNVTGIGIVGTGTQARLQLTYLKSITDCKRVYVWGRSEKAARDYADEVSQQGYDVIPALDITKLADHCNLIVTTTPSTQPLLMAKDIKPGTHITAIGADGKGKQELDPLILKNADIVALDSRSQCIDHGEVADAVEKKLLETAQLVELGELIAKNQRREHENQITIADLTGLATQDIQIAKLVYSLHRHKAAE